MHKSQNPETDLCYSFVPAFYDFLVTNPKLKWLPSISWRVKFLSILQGSYKCKKKNEFFCICNTSNCREWKEKLFFIVIKVFFMFLLNYNKQWQVKKVHFPVSWPFLQIDFFSFFSSYLCNVLPLLVLSLGKSVLLIKKKKHQNLVKVEHFAFPSQKFVCNKNVYKNIS